MDSLKVQLKNNLKMTYVSINTKKYISVTLNMQIVFVMYCKLTHC